MKSKNCIVHSHQLEMSGKKSLNLNQGWRQPRRMVSSWELLHKHSRNYQETMPSWAVDVWSNDVWDPCHATIGDLKYPMDSAILSILSLQQWFVSWTRTWLIMNLAVRAFLCVFLSEIIRGLLQGFLGPILFVEVRLQNSGEWLRLATREWFGVT